MILAPMEDVTDTVFRQIIVSCGRPDVFFTEFTNTDGLMSEGFEKVKKRLEFAEIERPIVAQIWGNTPENYYNATKLIIEMGFDGIDINMGCPVRKVVGKGFCSGLIQNPNLASELIMATKEASGEIPVSVKTRIGYNKVITEEWTEFLLKHDLDALTVHGRTSKQMSKVPADWNEIAKVVTVRDQLFKEGIIKTNTLIIGNGDVESLVDAKKKADKYKLDGIMIGRGIFKDPFVFNPDKSFAELTIKEKLEIMLKHTEMFERTWKEEKSFALMKKFFKIYVSGFEGAPEFRAELMKCKNYEEVKKVVSENNI